MGFVFKPGGIKITLDDKPIECDNVDIKTDIKWTELDEPETFTFTRYYETSGSLVTEIGYAEYERWIRIMHGEFND